MRYFLLCFAFLALSYARTASAECVQDCTDSEQICVDQCVEDTNKVVRCTNHCSTRHAPCRQTCSPPPNPPWDGKDAKSTSKLLQRFHAQHPAAGAFPLSTDGGEAVPNCCTPTGSRSPLCGLVLCPINKGLVEGNTLWTGKLFQPADLPVPMNICRACLGGAPQPICTKIYCSNDPVAAIPTATSKEWFRKHLETLRMLNDGYKAEGLITGTDHQKFLEAYKKDFRSVFRPPSSSRQTR